MRILYVMKILLEKTDENHSITIKELNEQLRQYDCEADRKTLYSDIEHLRTFGLDIIGEKGNKTYLYHVGNRRFELAELKLLVDSVQAAKFITPGKSADLVRKLECLTSEYERKQLQRQVYMSERNKAVNESVFYNVDQIHTAIDRNCRIQFQYFRWNVNKEMELKKDGAWYNVSPWALMWEDENYYLVAYDTDEHKIKHFRVDKMVHIELQNQSRQGVKAFRDFDMGLYSKKVFGMFDGEEVIVQIKCRNEMAGVMIDRFGQDIPFQKIDEEHFRLNVKVAVSRQFLGWILALGEGVRIVGPESVLHMIREEVERYSRQYLFDKTAKIKSHENHDF